MDQPSPSAAGVRYPSSTTHPAEDNPLPRTPFRHHRLPELQLLERLIRKGGERLGLSLLAEIEDEEHTLPLYALSLGSDRPDAPVLLLIGGVHGVERIGTQLLLAQLGTLLSRLTWDQGLGQELEQLRIVFCPLANPVGMAHGWRCNGNGVDLMRNAPVEAEQPYPWLVAGHRIGRWLPWYRGEPHAPMQREAVALCALVRKQTQDAPFSLVLDCHSGFGMRDRVWFPYSGSTRPLEHAAEVHALIQTFEHAHPHHPYLFEPQCHQYRTHGDLWDYLYRQHLGERSGVFLPLTLEMGSWLWVKKNLRQLTSFPGLFNPLVPHRRKRTLRRHAPLLEFLIRATRSWRHWLPGTAARARHQRCAERRWYHKGGR